MSGFLFFGGEMHVYVDVCEADLLVNIVGDFGAHWALFALVLFPFHRKIRNIHALPFQRK